MINLDLYELYHGVVNKEHRSYFDELETYFKPRREHVVGIIVLPNFCYDRDMTNFIHHIFPELKEFKIFRGLVVELRTNYKITKGDIQWCYPQLCKQRGLCELPAGTNIESVISRIKDMKEMKIDDLNSEINSSKFLLSPLYNNITIYQTTQRDSDWGTQVTKHMLGYDISCDLFIITFWKYLMCSEGINVSDLHNKFTTMRVQGNTTKNLLNDSAKGVVEFVTDTSEAELNWITDITTNWMFRNDREYFFFNHGVNLLGLNRRPMAMQTSMLAGLQIYKNIVTNAHPYKYCFPYDAGLLPEYHTYAHMNKVQQDRLEKTFFWNKTTIPFNTYLMTKVNKTNTEKWRRVETKLEVIPENFYAIVFSRISTHDVYHYMDAKDIIQLQPGDNKTGIFFPLQSQHIITEKMINNYKNLAHHNIINERFYDRQKNMLILPRDLAERILSYK